MFIIIMSEDYYKILGVSKTASKEEISKAYKKMAKKYHPDISKETDAEKKFKEVNNAYDTLKDEGKRNNYDNFGSDNSQGGFGGFNQQQSEGFSNFDFEDIFEQFGFGGGGNQRTKKKQKVADEYTQIYINLEEAFHSVKKEIEIDIYDKCNPCNGEGSKTKNGKKTCSTCNGQGVVFVIQNSILGKIKAQQTCPDCKGEGETIKDPCSSCNGTGIKKKRKNISLKIPKGIQDENSLRVSKGGNYDTIYKTYSDLFVKINVLDDEKYEVDDNDLQTEIKINFVEAIIGSKYDLEHFGKKLILKIPNGIQPNSILRVKTKGMPIINSQNFGDLYVKVKIEIPKKISNKQKEILKDYSKQDKGFFNKVREIFT